MITIGQAEREHQNKCAEAVRNSLDLYRKKTGRTMRYWLHTYGCQLNENDGEKISGLLEKMGYIATCDRDEADLIVLNTCSVRKHADDRLFGNLGRVKNLKRDRPDLLVAVCGCMVMQPEHRDKIEKSYSFVDLMFGPQDIYRLPELLYHRLFDQTSQYAVGNEDTIVEDLPVRRARRYRALCSIMYGCNNFCTYCIVPYTRGRERSRKPEAVLLELKAIADAGYREVMLLGQNVNAYGHDLILDQDEPGDNQAVHDFADLLEAAAQMNRFYRIRFMTSHPKDIPDKLIQVMAENPSIERHLHLPLQSGSNQVLKKMNRRYTREQYRSIVSLARKKIPDLTLSTDLIVGFPGETEEDFQQTLDLMEEIQFDSAFTFLFSRRTGTPAAEDPDQVPHSIKKERFERLVQLQNKHSLMSNKKLEGQLVELLVEGTSSRDEHIFSGRTSQNHLVNFRVPSHVSLPDQIYQDNGHMDGTLLEGSLARVRIDQAKTFSLMGTLEAWQP